jgi:hypothetical protein
MQRKSVQDPMKMRFLLGVLLVTCLFAVVANAQPSYEGRFTLTHTVNWGNVVLPAGEYTITLESLDGPALVRSASGKTKFFAVARIKADAEKGGTSLVLTVIGNQRRVRSMNLPEFGRSLIYEPLTRNEREMFAEAGQVQAIPVITAEK